MESAMEGGGQPQTEEQMRAQLEEELRRITVLDMLVQTVVSIVNLAGQRLGITPDTSDLRDLKQVRLGIEAVRSLLPLLEQELPEQIQPVRDALAQLQMAYAREVGASGGGAEGGGDPPGSGGSGPGEKGEPGGPAEEPRGGEGTQTPPPPRPSGRLWVPPGSTS